MDDQFSAHRPRLRALAYRMLGSAAEADDVVQDAYLRFRSSDASAIRSVEAWLSTCVSRLCLDRLKSARARREVYVGPWLPEPIPTDEPDLGAAESLSMAFMLLLERLSPVERAAYLLHVVFEYDHQRIAEMLGKNDAAIRQSVHRAKQHLRESRPRFAPSKQRHAELLGAFAVACQQAGMAALGALLTEDARSTSDGGGQVQAARQVVQGRDAVARFFLGIIKKSPSAAPRVDVVELNGWPWLVLSDGARAHAAVGIETDGVQIGSVHVVVNPDKLHEVTRALTRS